MPMIEGSGNPASEIKIELPNDETIVRYSNFVIVSHSDDEIVLDFARMMPGQDAAKVVSRVIMTPKNVKMFLNALSTNVANYEKKWGPIAVPENRSGGEDPDIQ